MCEQVIDYESNKEFSVVPDKDKACSGGEKNGLKWMCKYIATTKQKPEHLAWMFEWDPLNFEPFDGFRADCTAFYYDKNKHYTPVKFSVDLLRPEQTVQKELACLAKSEDFYAGNGQRWFKYHFKLTPVSFYKNIFMASDLTDAVLIVEGKKIHVNKGHLAVHSEFFRSMFFSEFKEKSIEEVEIKDVNYRDLALLLSQIYPKPPRIADAFAEILLKLADRFLMSGVISQIELHLLEHSYLNNSRLLLLADKYGLERLMEKTVTYYETKEEIKLLNTSSEYEELSSDTKLIIYERFINLI